MDAEGSVHVFCVSLVKPTKPTPRHVLYMSSVDQLLSTSRPGRTILLYDAHTDAAAAATILKQGLASALVAFYPLAGQLVRDDDGRLAIDCNDTGVELIEASCDLPFTDLQLHDFSIRPLFRRLVAMDDHLTSDHIGEPIASVQVTSFVGGGLALGFAVSHSVADGYSFWMFVRAVAEACKGGPLSVFPLHARSLLRSDNFSLNKCLPPASARELLPGDAEESSRQDDTITEPTSGLSPNQKISSIPPEQLKQRVIHISKDMLQTLKMACLDTHKHPFSSFQALSAYLWKRLTMAQELPDKTHVNFPVALDVRRRLIPPLTLAYFGNAVAVVMVSTTAKELKAESLGATAARIRQGVENGDDAHIKKVITEKENLDLRTVLVQGEEVDFFIRNGSHFPVYQASAFGWGELAAVRPPWGHSETTMTWYPSKEPGGIVVITSLSASTASLFFSPSLYPNDPLLPYHHAFLHPLSSP